MKKILILEDDANLGFLLQEHLRMHLFHVTLCTNGEEGLLQVDTASFDMILADIMMPKVDGFSFITRLRQSDETTPVIFLTARSLNEDRIEGFKRGCDDYVTKPFSMEELLLRMQAIFRRTGKKNPDEAQSEYIIGRYTFIPDKQLLYTEEQKSVLTTRESELLLLLCKHKNAVLEREYALKQIWGSDSYFNARSMDVFIVRLRKLLKADPALAILNIHGKGYKLLVTEPH